MAVIFDGDGTLWRPKGGDLNSRPDTIYSIDNKNSHTQLDLVNGVRKMLSTLKNRGYKIFVLSAHPKPGKDAKNELYLKLSALGIYSLIDNYFCSDGHGRDGKTKVIEYIIDYYDLNSAETYMVGDSYYYDYKAGLNAGVNSIFIKNSYCKQPSPLPDNVRTINQVADCCSIIK